MEMFKSFFRYIAQHWWAWLVSLIVLAACGVSIFRIGFVNFVDNYEMAYKFDARTGTLEILSETKMVGETKEMMWQHGYFVTPPFVVMLHTIDLRPMQVCINANQRVLNCKLVQFNPAGLDLFLEWHGRNDYSGPVDKSTGNLGEILKSYAYDGSGKSYPFLTVLRELKPDEVVQK